MLIFLSVFSCMYKYLHDFLLARDSKKKITEKKQRTHALIIYQFQGFKMKKKGSFVRPWRLLAVVETLETKNKK